jgi:hypothetical protein
LSAEAEGALPSVGANNLLALIFRCVALRKAQAYARSSLMPVLSVSGPDEAVCKIHPGNQKGKSMSDEEMKAELERLRRENETFKKGASSGIHMKVSEKGAVF